MRIGEVASRSGLSDKTIRYYEDIGVLEHPTRARNGYREYDRSVLDRLRFVRAAQSVGLKLGEIREVIALRDRGQTPCGHVVDIIEKRAREIDESISTLEKMRTELRRLVRRARTLDPKDCAPEKICHVIDQRRGRTSN